MTVDADVPSEQAPTAPKAKSVRSLVVTWLRRLLLVAVVIGAGYYLISRWDEVWATLGEVPWYSAVLSLLAVVAGILSSTVGWQAVVDDLGKPVGRVVGSQIFLVSQLGKYVPGAVWAYVLQMELGRKAGLARSRMFISSLVQLGVSVVASLALGVLALPVLLDETPGAVWLYAVLPFGLAALHPKIMTWGVNLILRVLRKAPLDHTLRWSTIMKTLGFAVATYVLFGVHLWLLATGSGSARFSVLLLCIGAIAIGLTAGLFFFILPSGAGVRDVLVALALTPAVGPVAAAAFAVASRAMFTVADGATAGVAAVVARLRLPAEPETDAPLQP